MKIEIKKVYEKMIDFHRFATVLLAVAVFLYLGVIIPKDSTQMNQLVGMGGTILFLSLSILFFFQSKKLRKRLEDTEEGQNFLMKK
ncbi:YrhC family protein [Neobacillus sp. D3-1R]|uniref:YrhC family protein n=1 Tax=Neobacillus sp. D3-1R TaxID=3445778 RepID=UPI003F9F2996